MTSENKRRKEKNNPHSAHGFALKEKLMKLKGRLYFNSSTRQELKKNDELTLLENELAEMKEYHKQSWLDYGSELCAGDMSAKERKLEEQISALKENVR